MSNYVIVPEMNNAKLRYDFNAICELEDMYDSLPNLFADKKVFNSTRNLLLVGLRWEKPDISISEVGDLIAGYLSSGKTFEDLREHINTALVRSGVVKLEEETQEKN